MVLYLSSETRMAFSFHSSSRNPLAKMESRASPKTYQLPEEAILGITSNVQLPPYIKIASHYGARDVSDEVGSIFAGCPFLLVRFLFGKEKKMNAEIFSACRR